MRIGFVFYGIAFGPGGRTGSDRDIRHCWPNIQKMLIEPFMKRGHDALVFFSTYPFDESLYNEFFELTKFSGVVLNKFEGSDPFTCKGNALGPYLDDANLDLIVLSRSDVHYSRVIAEETTIDYGKFNFLFPEGDGWWESQWRFTCDNFYLFPAHMRQAVHDALHDTYTWPRGKPLVDTHGLINKLADYIPSNQMNIISLVPEISDVNSFYTCCRSGLPEDGRGGHIHPEVKERFNYSDESSNRSRSK